MNFLFFSRLRVGVVEMRWGNLGEGGEESVLRRLRSDRDLEHCLLRNSSLLQWLHQNETYTSPKTGRTIRPENKSKHYYVFKFKSSENNQFNENFKFFFSYENRTKIVFLIGNRLFSIFECLTLVYCELRTGNKITKCLLLLYFVWLTCNILDGLLKS